ncbi:MAG TPA: GDP-mannose 4,6-dehydratase [Pirellulales bacterium]|nr:GDP-mannose 4,6-dehydratase [Pirellulales bacterium]
MRKIAVIGSNSFSGSDYIDLLLESPERQVLGISRSPEKSRLFLPYKRWNDGRFTFHQFDLNRHTDEILAELDRFEPEAVVNFAAQSEVAPSWEHPEHWFQTNTVALARLLNPLKDRAYLKRYVHISSPEVYGTCVGRVTEETPVNPSTPYAASKAAADMFLATLVKNFQFPLITIRATNVYGAHQQLWKIIPRTAIYLLSNRKISLHGGGTAVKSYIHIRDVSRGELLAMECGRPGAIYHLSPDRGYAVREVVERICRLLGRDFSTSAVTVGERLGQDAAYIIDSARAREQLGWQPQIELATGLDEVVDWVRKNLAEICNQPLEYRHAA